MGRGKRRGQSVRLGRQPLASRPAALAASLPAVKPRSKARNDVDRRAKRMFELAMSQERRYQADPGSDLADAHFCEYFAGKLAEAHIVNRYRVEGRQFETLLADAARASGREAELAESLTSVGHDLIVDGERLQLKTEAAKAIRHDRITISKLMESAGTKKVQRRADAVRFIPNIRAHLDRYDRLLVLRAFGQVDEEGTRGVRYELTEVPKRLFAGLERLTWRDFTEPLASGQTTAQIHVAADPAPAMTLVFDGSDNKITLRNLRRDLCRVHAVFWVPYGDEIVKAAEAEWRRLEA